MVMPFDDEELRRRQAADAAQAAALGGLPPPVVRAEDLPLPVPAIGTPQGGFAPQVTEVGDPGQTQRLFDPITGRTGFKGNGDQGFVMPRPEPFTAANDPALATGLADYMARMAARSDVNTPEGRAARAESLRYSDQGIRYGDPLQGQQFQAEHVFAPVTQPPAAAAPKDWVTERLNQGLSPEQLQAIAAGVGPYPWQNQGVTATNPQPQTSVNAPGPARVGDLGIPGAQGVRLPANTTTLTTPREPAAFRPGAAPGGPEGPTAAAVQESQNRTLLQSAIAGRAPQVGETQPDRTGVTFPTLGLLRTPDGVDGTIVRLPNGQIRIWNHSTNDYEDPGSGVWARYSR